MAETSDERDNITIAEVESFVDTVDTCVEQLLQATRQLPQVDDDGSSECPFAEQLYAEKEEAQRDAEICLEKLGEYIEWVEDQISRCKGNLSIISSGLQQLNTDAARDRLSEAEDNLEAFGKKLSELHDKVDEAMKKLDSALAESVPKRFPGKIPQKYPPFSEPPMYSSCPDEDSSEMLSMGPIDTGHIDEGDE